MEAKKKKRKERREEFDLVCLEKIELKGGEKKVC